MKYLKIVENIESDHFVRIRANQFYTPEGRIRFDKYDFLPYEANALTNKGFNLSKSTLCFSKHSIISSRFDFIGIYKSDDGWYYVESGKMNLDNFYKCDQWDGLLNCLKKEFDI